MGIREDFANIQIQKVIRDFLKYKTTVLALTGEKTNIRKLIEGAIVDKYKKEIKEYKALAKSNNKKGGK